MTKRYDDTAFYDFEKNYADAVDLIRKVFGDERADAVAAARGKSTRTDFMTAITWGWFMHRPVLGMQERAICIIGNMVPKGLEKGLRDYAQLGMAAGLHPEKIREAIFTLSIYGGVPTTEWALGVVDDLCAELDRKGWRPFTPPGPLYERVEHNFYDFEDNYIDGVDYGLQMGFPWVRANPEETREQRLERTGQSALGDFGAIHWGWIMHRPFISPRERAFFLIGSDSANKGYLALQDHVKFGLLQGITREEVQEAMAMLNLYNGWPANRQANNAVTELFAELDKQAAGGDR